MWYLTDTEKPVIVGLPDRSRRIVKNKLKKREHCYGVERKEETERDED
jgi:hypothetical protein